MAYDEDLMSWLVTPRGTHGNTKNWWWYEHSSKGAKKAGEVAKELVKYSV